MKVALGFVVLSLLVASLVVVANEDYFVVTVDEVDPVIIEYLVVTFTGQCYGNPPYKPTTGEYETYYKHYFDEGEAEPGEYLCLRLSTPTGYTITTQKIEPMYRTYLPGVALNR